MLQIERRHTAGMGHHMRLTMSDDVFDALDAAVQVAFDDPESVPDEFKDVAAKVWREFALARGVEASS